MAQQLGALGTDRQQAQQLQPHDRTRRTLLHRRSPKPPAAQEAAAPAAPAAPAALAALATAATSGRAMDRRRVHCPRARLKPRHLARRIVDGRRRRRPSTARGRAKRGKLRGCGCGGLSGPREH
jgi:hypothetical protein